MTTAEIVDLLAAHRTLGSAPRDEFEWLARRGTLRHHPPGVVLSAKGMPVESLYVLFTGRAAMFVDRGDGRDKAFEWTGGDVSGVLPYSRLVKAPGDAIVQEPMTLLEIHRTHLRDLTRECHAVTARLVHTMLDRARAFTTSDLRNEKMISLRKLSAGLAHELNNPAAAIERSAALLGDRLDEAERAARTLGAARLTDEQLAAVDRVRAACGAAPHGVRSPLEQIAHEQAVADWLSARGRSELERVNGNGRVESVTLRTLDSGDTSVEPVSRSRSRPACRACSPPATSAPGP